MISAVHKTNVFIPDHKELNDPEVLAMLQAMYSRSDMGIEDRLADMAMGDVNAKQDRVKRAINTYYLSYGHASIADCANVPVFIEGVSMLAAKALQDHPLYNGQERSTRYQDFGSVPFVAVGEPAHAVAETWRGLYKAYLPLLEVYVAQEYDSVKDEIISDKITEPEKRATSWAKSVKAIAFDIARGLLPCGATTSLSMYMSLRQFRDHLTVLATHPLQEVRDIALKINGHLFMSYPNTFKPIREATANVINDRAYMLCQVHDNASHAKILDVHRLGVHSGPYLAKWGKDTFYGLGGAMDFGSYRDLQRHRNGENQMPMVSILNGFNHYYTKILKTVSPELFQEVLDLYDKLMSINNANGGPGVNHQYMLPMMTNVSVGLYWSLAQVKYATELRSKTSVHPTCRQYFHSLYDQLDKEAQALIVCDKRGHYIQSNRGEQDMKRRPEVTL